MSTYNYGDAQVRNLSSRVAAPVAAYADLKATAATRRSAYQTALVQADGSQWYFHPTSVLAGDDVLVIAPDDGAGGRWLRLPGATRLRMPITFATTDATLLLTVPAGCTMQVLEAYWSIAADFTGGSNSAIGLSSSNKTSLTTKGDLLGGASGDLAAALTAALSPAMGTIGAGFDTLAKRRPFWRPGETVRFDRIASAFTAGSGHAVLSAVLLKNEGA